MRTAFIPFVAGMEFVACKVSAQESAGTAANSPDRVANHQFGAVREVRRVEPVAAGLRAQFLKLVQ
jgi:hypothetical protein